MREEGANNLENVTAMYPQIDEIQAAYDNGFLGNCMPTSVTNLFGGINNLKIFPNPATDILTIQFPELKLQTLRLIDVTGKVVLEKWGTFSDKTTLDCTTFSKGIYFLQLENETQRFYEKIIIQ